jgi:hypothetical protein
MLKFAAFEAMADGMFAPHGNRPRKVINFRQISLALSAANPHHRRRGDERFHLETGFFGFDTDPASSWHATCIGCLQRAQNARKREKRRDIFS